MSETKRRVCSGPASTLLSLVEDTTIVNPKLSSVKQKSKIYHQYMTPNKAFELLESHKWSTQRKVRPSNVQHFDRLFMSGQWDDHTIIEVVVTPEGRFLNDGQNRLSSIISTGSRNVRIVETPFASEEEARKHYANTDRNGIKRSSGDALMAYLHDCRTTVTTEQLSKLCSAIRFMNSGFNDKKSRSRHGRKLEDFELAVAVREWMSETLEAYTIISQADRNIRSRMPLCPVLSLMIVTLKFNHDQAREFWANLALDNGLKKGQPEKALITYMTSPGCTIESIGANVWARKVAAAYNAYCKSESIFELRSYIDKPIVIYRTPLKGIVHRFYEPGQGFVMLENVSEVEADPEL